MNDNYAGPFRSNDEWLASNHPELFNKLEAQRYEGRQITGTPIPTEHDWRDRGRDHLGSEY